MTDFLSWWACRLGKHRNLFPARLDVPEGDFFAEVRFDVCNDCGKAQERRREP